MDTEECFRVISAGKGLAARRVFFLHRSLNEKARLVGTGKAAIPTEMFVVSDGREGWKAELLVLRLCASELFRCQYFLKLP